MGWWLPSRALFYNRCMPTGTRDFEKTLRAAPLFAGLTDTQFSLLASRLVERSFDAGEMIFQEGQPCAGLFIIQSGSVRIFKNSSTGREQVLSIEGAGASIAELPVFDGGAYPASSQALAKSSLLFLSKQDFRALCMQHPEVSLQVLRKVGARLRQLVGIIEDLSFTTVRHRLACAAVALGAHRGPEDAGRHRNRSHRLEPGYSCANRNRARTCLAQSQPLPK